MSNLTKDTSLEELDQMDRYSMLDDQASIVCKIVTDYLEINSLIDLEEIEHNMREEKELEKSLEKIKKELKKIKESLTEKQFSKIEESYDTIENEIWEME